MRRLISIILLDALILVASISIVGAAPASASETQYSCKHCAHVSGPNAYPSDDVYAHNESGKGVCNKFWRYNGGSNYTLVLSECTASGTELLGHVAGLDGHGEVLRYYTEFLYNLSGETNDF